MPSSSTYPKHFILQDVAQSIDAVHSDIGNWSTTGHRGIMNPGANLQSGSAMLAGSIISVS